MARQLEHRGPGGNGTTLHGRVGLAHRHHAAAHHEGDAQPVYAAAGRYVMVADGELYNRRDLSGELAANGCELTTNSDAEVILAAWVLWGAAGFERCDGAFAVAILDTDTGDVVLARDAFGIKPLYLATDGSGRVAFGSEPRAILAAGVVPRRPDERTLYRYLRYGIHDDTERTFFDRITRLLPGQLAVVTPTGQVRRESYTQLRKELEWLFADPRSYGRAEAVEVRGALADSVRRRLAGRAHVGTVLTGGLAPASVVATVDRLLAGSDPDAVTAGPVQRTFSTGETDPEYEAAVAAACGPRLTVHKVLPDPDRFRADFTDFVRTQQEPVATPEAYAGYCLARAARDRVSVLLSAIGAAQLLAGGHPYLLVRLRELRRQRRFRALAGLLVRNAGTLRQLAADRLRRRPAPAGRLLAPDFAAAHADPPPHEVRDDLKRRLADDLFQHRLPALLRYQDRNNARFSVGSRAPFLDPQLVKLLCRLETAAIAGGGRDQRVLRDAELLPPFARRHARAWRIPLRPAWCDQLRELAQEVFTSDAFTARPYFDRHAVLAALPGRRGIDGELWRILNVELWLQQMIDRDPTVSAPRPAPTPAVDAARRPSPPKPDWQPNRDKQLVTVDGRWARFPLQVPMVRSGDDVARLAAGRTARFYAHLDEAPPETVALVNAGRWYLFLCEKAAALAQGGADPAWQVNPSWWARYLSRFVVANGAGGDPTATQRAIDQVGLPRVLAASAASAADKAVGRRGQRAAIHNGLPPVLGNGSRLGLEDPVSVARSVSGAIRRRLPPPVAARYGGAAVISANDRSRTVLGHDTELPTAELVAAFVDNPLGQGREQTPLAVVVSL